MKVSFTYYGNPSSKGRPRATIRGKHAAVYTDAKTVNAEKSFMAQAIQFKPAKPLEGALYMEINIYIQVSKTMVNSKRKLSDVENGIDENTLRPANGKDVDNISKIYMDAMNSIFYRDDSQIVSLSAKKYYTIDTPRVEIVLIELNEKTSI